MDSDNLNRALDAVKAAAADLDLSTDEVVVLHNSNKLALRLLPCDVFARVAHVGREVAAFEIDIAQQLLAVGAPMAQLEARVAPLVYQQDGFAITWWVFHESKPGGLPAADYALALARLHAGMRKVHRAAPHFLDRVAEAEQLIASADRTPGLDSPGRRLLLDTFTTVRHRIESRGAVEQLLHGEPHPGNILNTAGGPRFIDLETCCIGPVEFDVAHAPIDVGRFYPNSDSDSDPTPDSGSDPTPDSGLDLGLLSDCRRLILAMVAAWRWDPADQFPDGLRHGRAILELLEHGHPWPALGDLGDH